jgi:hypothetical protein
MKRWTTTLAVLVLVVMAVLPAAAASEKILPNGTHWELHLIGSPNGISGDTSNGRSIMIPLKNAGKNGVPTITCEPDEVVYVPDPGLQYTNQVPAGAKLHWQLGDTFQIIDRDATDGDATIQIPWVDPLDGSDQMAVDVWVRVHGKPNTCMDISAWAVDSENATGQTYYFLAGTLDLNRKTGKAAWTQVNGLFDVDWCELGTITNPDGTTSIGCTGGVSEELSVFSDVFSDYFWNIVNDGTRNVEIRLYPK